MDQLRVLVPTPAASNAICRLAEREGLYAKHGLEAEVRVVGDSSALLREARNGAASAWASSAATTSCPAGWRFPSSAWRWVETSSACGSSDLPRPGLPPWTTAAWRRRLLRHRTRSEPKRPASAS